MNPWKQIVWAVAVSALASSLISAYAAAPAGWLVAGSAPKDYEFGTDAAASRDGGKAAFIKSIAPNSSGFGTLMQNVSPERYAGKRVRLSAGMRTSNAIRGQMWLRIDGSDNKPLAFDNMGARPATGTTEWKRYEIVLDVPAEAKNIAFGFMLFGTGMVWADDFALEIVDRTVPLTVSTRPAETSRPLQPSNASFEE